MNLNEKKQNAFTLVELLVVMAIISLLMAIIVPVLGRAKDQSRIVICRSNQRNILLGCLAYADENNCLLPVSTKLHNPHSKLIEDLSLGSYIKESEIYY